MELPREQEAPDKRAGKNTSNELIKRIRKLRWVGMEEEAERLQRELKRGDVAAEDSVLAIPRDTD